MITTDERTEADQTRSVQSALKSSGPVKLIENNGHVQHHDHTSAERPPISRRGSVISLKYGIESRPTPLREKPAIPKKPSQLRILHKIPSRHRLSVKPSMESIRSNETFFSAVSTQGPVLPTQVNTTQKEVLPHAAPILSNNFQCEDQGTLKAKKNSLGNSGEPLEKESHVGQFPLAYELHPEYVSKTGIKQNNASEILPSQDALPTGKGKRTSSSSSSYDEYHVEPYPQHLLDRETEIMKGSRDEKPVLIVPEKDDIVEEDTDHSIRYSFMVAPDAPASGIMDLVTLYRAVLLYEFHLEPPGDQNQQQNQKHQTVTLVPGDYVTVFGTTSVGYTDTATGEFWKRQVVPDFPDIRQDVNVSGGWCQVETDEGLIGFVPISYLQFEDELPLSLSHASLPESAPMQSLSGYSFDPYNHQNGQQYAGSSRPPEISSPTFHQQPSVKTSFSTMTSFPGANDPSIVSRQSSQNQSISSMFDPSNLFKSVLNQFFLGDPIQDFLSSSQPILFHPSFQSIEPTLQLELTAQGFKWSSALPQYQVMVHSPLRRKRLSLDNNRRVNGTEEEFVSYKITTWFPHPVVSTNGETHTNGGPAFAGKANVDAFGEDFHHGNTTSVRTDTSRPSTASQSGLVCMTVERRYTDFTFLHTLLASQYPPNTLTTLPSQMPSKNAFSSRFDPVHLKQRQEQLGLFLTRIVSHPIVRSDPILLSFLSSGGIENQLEHVYSTTTEFDPEEIHMWVQDYPWNAGHEVKPVSLHDFYSRVQPPSRMDLNQVLTMTTSLSTVNQAHDQFEEKIRPLLDSLTRFEKADHDRQQVQVDAAMGLRYVGKSLFQLSFGEVQEPLCWVPECNECGPIGDSLMNISLHMKRAAETTNCEMRKAVQEICNHLHEASVSTSSLRTIAHIHHVVSSSAAGKNCPPPVTAEKMMVLLAVCQAESHHAHTARSDHIRRAVGIWIDADIAYHEKALSRLRLARKSL